MSSGVVEASDGGEVRRSEKVLEGIEALSANRTNGFYSRVSDTRSADVHSKETKSITKGENQGQKETAVAPPFNQVDQLCTGSQNYHYVHAELAKLVVEIECKGSMSEPTMPLARRGSAWPF